MIGALDDRGGQGLIDWSRARRQWPCSAKYAIGHLRYQLWWLPRRRLAPVSNPRSTATYQNFGTLQGKSSIPAPDEPHPHKRNTRAEQILNTLK
jgi:hypothetical protein